MKTNLRLGVLALLLILPGRHPARALDAPEPAPLRPVAHVDLQRYLGLWYEIAKIPNRFQDHCHHGATARYTLRDDGRLDVVNQCFDVQGKVDVARGIARIVDPRTNARLKVSFVSFLGWRPFWGDYWVIGLDADYKWAIVGTPSRKYGWVLGRTPDLPPETLAHIWSILERKGYDPDRFERSSP